MAMRIEVAFARPLTRDDRVAATLAVAGLAKAESIRFVRGDRAATVHGEGMTAQRVREVLVEVGLPVESVASSLVEAEDRQLDDAPGAVGGERVRAIGR